MRYLLASFICLTILSSCAERRSPQAVVISDTKGFLEDVWALHPSFGSAVGKHEYDDLLTIKDQKWRSDFLALIKKYEDKTVADDMDQKLIRNFLEQSRWEIEVFKDYEWDPSNYNIGGAFDAVISNKTLSQDQKIKILTKKLSFVPRYYQSAKENIYQPTREHLELSVKQMKGLISFFESDVFKLVNDTAARTAMADFLAWEESLLKDPSPVGGYRSFRLGEKMYAQKFAFEMVANTSPQEVHQWALKEKTEALKKMASVARGLWPKYFPKQAAPKNEQALIQKVISKVAQSHAEAEKFVDEIRAQIPVLEKFVADNKLVTLDPTKPLKVRETPEYMQDFAGASIDSPGFFEPHRETYYNVTPPTKLSKAEQESFLREYNNYTLQILNIHEAIPGHYAQQVYSNKTPSVIKAVFGNGATIEGWAVYSERMMIESGYGKDTPELALMYGKWFLRVITNTIIDYEIHCENLSREQALKYMIDDAFQERQEAEQKWNRATVSQVQLATYFYGFSEIYRLREELKTKSNTFDLLKFHEKFLSYGSAPISAIRSAMVNN